MTVTSSKVVDAGKALNITIVVMNVSGETILLPETCNELDYKLTVIDPKGEISKLTEKGRKMNSDMGLSLCRRKNLKLLPGKSKEIILEASSVYDMTMTGRYKITVFRSFRSLNGDITNVKSKPIFVIVGKSNSSNREY